MTIFGLPAAIWLSWLLALAFFGAGVVNAAGPSAIKDDFVRWGYPRWWNLVTGGLELAAAGLIATPTTRLAGLTLATAIGLAAVATLAWNRDYRHIIPALLLAVLPALDLALLIG